MMFYNPRTWYWAVGGGTDQVWSGAAAEYVQITDAGYVAWLADGNRPTVIESETSLHDVLAAAGMPTANIGAVQQRAAVLLAASDVAVTFATAPDLNASYQITTEMLSDVGNIQVAIQAGVAGTAIPFPTAAGTEKIFAPAQFTAFAAALFAYIVALKRCARGSTSTIPAPSLTVA